MVLFAVLSRCLPAQTTVEARFADDIRSAADLAAAKPLYSAWRSSKALERVELSHYETEKDPYAIDLFTQWCVTSVADIAARITRAASFYLPEVVQGALPPLPARQDSSLTDSCRLGAVWYEAHDVDLVPGVVKELSAAWGSPDRPSRPEMSKLGIWASGLWREVSMWRRGDVTIWVAWTDASRGATPEPRTIVWIARDRPPDFDLFTAGFDTTAAALKLTGLPAMKCEAEGLARLLKAPGGAALLVADSFVSCAEQSGSTRESLQALGARYERGCPQDGAAYSHNFRERARTLDPTGPAGALAALATLQSPCAVKGPGPWPENVLLQGQKDLQQFPPGPWTPWVHFALARAHDVKLSFSMPPGEADAGVVHRLTDAQARQERTAAIAEFERFIRARPSAPSAVFAWREAWRLMAGLPPTQTQFGCGCE
jgi:hypothetical protein